MADKVLLNPIEIERDYGIPKSTQSKGRMGLTDFPPFIKRGRSVFVLKSDLDDWLAGLKRRSTSEPAK
jgi:hypothetical protein